MGDQEKVEPEYLRGFNEGYLLARENPELAQKLAGIESDFIRLVAFKDGMAQFQKEIEKVPLPKWLKQDHVSREQHDTLSKDNQIDRDIEPER